MNVPQTFARAVQHHQAGQLAQAETLYRQILAVEPAHAEALQHLGVLAQQAGQPNTAIELLRRAIAVAPHHASAHLNLGCALAGTGQHHEAITEFQRVLELQPNAIDARLNLGLALDEAGQFEEAIATFRRAIEFSPDFVHAHMHLARVLREHQRSAEAVPVIERLLALEPENPDFHNLLGATLAECLDFEKAVDAFQRALQRKPDSPGFLCNLARSLRDICRFEESLAATRSALALDPDLVEAHLNLGNIFADQRQFDLALAAYDHALALRPGWSSAQLNRALLLLVHGDFERGWPGYESRLDVLLPSQSAPRTYAQPRWDGGAVEGKRILFHTEQGFGDAIQCVRYAALVADRGGEVIIECRPSLAELLRTAPGVHEVTSTRDPLPAHDFVVPILSLPFLFKTNAATIPRRVPYLFAEPARREIWRQRLLPHSDRLKIGLAWTGNHHHPLHARRTLDPAQLLPLLALEGIDFFSLQLLPKSDPAPRFSNPHLVDHTTHLRDFADTAAFIMELDLVITVDTSIAHLSGALGRPTWTLLSSMPDWRWGLESDRTPWYPTMRLFRQSQFGNWEGIIQEVARELSTATRETLHSSAGRTPPAS